MCSFFFFFFFFFNATATTEIYTLSLHDALPICWSPAFGRVVGGRVRRILAAGTGTAGRARSEEHTSELQSRRDLVCRLLLEKKKKKKTNKTTEYNKNTTSVMQSTSIQQALSTFI